jgi:hypothetical protein
MFHKDYSPRFERPGAKPFVDYGYGGIYSVVVHDAQGTPRCLGECWEEDALKGFYVSRPFVASSPDFDLSFSVGGGGLKADVRPFFLDYLIQR